MELYRERRPADFDEVIGQDKAVASLKRKLKTDFPHAVILHGPYGTGKTTLAFIIAKHLKCYSRDMHEMNSADYRGVESVRDIRRVLNQAPMHGESIVWLFDEAHRITAIAFDALLKMLENAPGHVYFIFATTEFNKIPKGIQQRCTLKVKLNPIKEDDLYTIVDGICEEEKLKLSEEVLEKIIEHSGGSAREAIQILDAIYELKNEREIIEAIESATIKTQTILIARKLLDTKTKWKPMAALLKELKDEDPEQIRRMVVGYAQAVLLNGDNARAFRMMELFRDNFYDCGFAGVVAGCYEVINT